MKNAGTPVYPAIPALDCQNCPSGFRMPELLILALSGGFGLLLAAYRGLLVSFSLANLLNDTRAGARLLETSECAVKRFLFLDSDFR